MDRRILSSNKLAFQFSISEWRLLAQSGRSTANEASLLVASEQRTIRISNWWGMANDTVALEASRFRSSAVALFSPRICSPAYNRNRFPETEIAR
jgi:hypothetical protein